MVLRSLDEARPLIKTTIGIDCRREFATVVVGHPQFATGFTEDEVAETIRTYNSHLSRIEVITYKDLLDGAERALAWTASRTRPPCGGGRVRGGALLMSS